MPNWKNSNQTPVVFGFNGVSNAIFRRFTGKMLAMISITRGQSSRINELPERKHKGIIIPIPTGTAAPDSGIVTVKGNPRHVKEIAPIMTLTR
jgi:hypothetical protein